MIKAFIGDYTQHPPKHLHTRRPENLKYHFLNSASATSCVRCECNMWTLPSGIVWTRIRVC
jgi:hypothetical protein